MNQTGIFFHQVCRDNDIDWLLKGRLVNFPQILKRKGLLDKDGIHYYESPQTANKLLQKVHTSDMITQVTKTPYYETALRSTGGTVEAAKKIVEGKIDNAFVFTGSADHHAGRDRFWGGCHFNGAALAITWLRENSLFQRFAIVDTDHHHGDGTRDIVESATDVLHICFCNETTQSADQTKVDIRTTTYPSTDDQYISIFAKEFPPRIRQFKPDIIFWEFGYDNTHGDYGDIGLTMECHLRIFEEIKHVADEMCRRRLIVILCGGSSSQTAEFCIPEIIAGLAGVDNHEE
jgi:acetoin utilization deacetylase AcuC-like enzyme